MIRPTCFLKLECHLYSLKYYGLHVLIFFAGFSFIVHSIEPSNAHSDPSIATKEEEEEDDSARCRLSGICEGQPALEECLQYRIDDGEVARPAGSIPSYDFAARRDAVLACEFTPVDRAARVRDAARWTWRGYKDCARGWDELRPVSCKGQEWHKLQLTPVDAMDTLALMNLHQEFDEAFQLVKEQLTFTEECNVFETTIRILGGLLSTHHIVTAHSDKDIDDAANESISLDLLHLAVDVGSRLFRAFNSPSGIPYSDINLSTGSIERSVLHSSMAEATTLSLEFTSLARLTGEKTFEIAAMKVHQVLSPSIEKYEGLLPQFVSPSDGSCSGDYFMLGARCDSYYEYLLKQWILTGQTDEIMLQRYIQAIQTVRKKLLRRSTGGLLYIAEETGNMLSPKMDHLVCFLPGVLALGDFYNISTRIIHDTENGNTNTTAFSAYYDATDLEIAEQLVETCYQMYRRTPTGLASEIVYFSENDSDTTTNIEGTTSAISTTTPSQSGSAEGIYPGAHASDIGGGEFLIKEDDAHNLLRPETVESLFVLWKVTGNKKYREQAWLIFRAFERWTRVEGVEQCLSVDAEAAAGTASREVVRIAAFEAARIFVGRGRSASEQAIKQGIEAGKAALEAMRLPAASTEQRHARQEATQAELIANACLGAAEAAARATVQILISSNATFNINDVADVSELEEKTSTTNGGHQARVCDFSTQIGGGYSNLESVKSIPPLRRDKMESFWIAETLKYFYLIFTESPDRCLDSSCNDLSVDEQRAVLPLTKFVFNTEAHPLPITGPMESSLIQPVGEINRKLLNPFAEISNEPVYLENEEDEDEVQGEVDVDGETKEDVGEHEEGLDEQPVDKIEVERHTEL